MHQLPALKMILGHPAFWLRGSFWFMMRTKTSQSHQEEIVNINLFFEIKPMIVDFVENSSK